MSMHISRNDAGRKVEVTVHSSASGQHVHFYGGNYISGPSNLTQYKPRWLELAVRVNANEDPEHLEAEIIALFDTK